MCVLNSYCCLMILACLELGSLNVEGVAIVAGEFKILTHIALCASSWPNQHALSLLLGTELPSLSSIVPSPAQRGFPLLSTSISVTFYLIPALSLLKEELHIKPHTKILLM